MGNKTKKATKHSSGNSRQQVVLRLILLIAALILINVLAFRFHSGIDFTNDQRFTLSKPTKNLLKNLDQTATVTVYLKGKFPAGFKKLAQATQEQLEAFKQASKGKVIFKFEDPFEGRTNSSEQKEVLQFMSDKGIVPMNLQRREVDEGYSEQFIFPWALVQYNGKEVPVPLMENYLGLSAQEILNNSESLLEYKFANALHQMSQSKAKRLAYIIGQDEWLNDGSYDFLTTVGSKYQLDTVDISKGIFIPDEYDAIIINGPARAFTDKEKLKIDQYIMRGGNVLWALNMLHTPMDSLSANNQAFTTMPMELNLDDQLFRYGVRINYNLIEDLACNPIPVTAGMKGGQPNIDLRPWIYFPVLQPASNHPIVKNMDGVMGVFVSSIDTIANEGVRKTILLHSSEYSRVAPSPARVSLTMLAFQPKMELFNKPYQPAAVLLEGNYESVFAGRISAEFASILRDTLKREFLAKSIQPGKQIVIADADILSNDVSASRGPYEMGYWRYTENRFANKTFALNCLEYLTDTTNMLQARNKERKLRLLDPARVKRESSQWATINIVVPIVAVLIFASAFMFFRKRRYEMTDTKTKNQK